MPNAKRNAKKSKSSSAPAIHKIQKFGWVPDLPDQRDFMYAAPAPFQQNIPPSVDLSNKCPPVYDQGQLGSCTANAIAAAIEFDQKKRFVPSRLFIYYNERVIEGTVGSDSGAQIRDGIKSVATQGAPRRKFGRTTLPSSASRRPQSPTLTPRRIWSLFIRGSSKT